MILFINYKNRKAYILKDKYNEFANTNCAIAYDGFRQMGWEILPFRQSDNPLLPDLTPADVVVGFIETVHTALLKLSIGLPDAVNYPDELASFLGRTKRSKKPARGLARCVRALGEKSGSCPCANPAIGSSCQTLKP